MITAKLDDVSRLLSELKVDLDASKLSVQRMILPEMLRVTIRSPPGQKDSGCWNSSKYTADRLIIRTQYSLKMYAELTCNLSVHTMTAVGLAHIGSLRL